MAGRGDLRPGSGRYRPSRRRLLRLAAVGGAGALLAACGGGGSGSSAGPSSAGLGTVAAGTGATATAAPTTAASAVKPGGTLRSARSTELQSFDSVENNNWVGGLALVLPIHDRLFEYDSKLRVVPGEGLVASFERPDALTYVMKLHQGVTFHDGTPFNARAVTHQFDRARNSPTSFAKG
ncbi:MAG: ABC transporter substrate-binding protein [Dehalococcoidia bacterium]